MRSAPENDTLFRGAPHSESARSTEFPVGPSRLAHVHGAIAPLPFPCGVWATLRGPRAGARALVLACATARFQPGNLVRGDGRPGVAFDLAHLCSFAVRRQ